MADAVGAVHIFYAVLVAELVADVVVAGIIQLAGRYQMVVDQDRFVRIPDPCESHLLELVFYKRNENIVDHHAVDIHGNDIAGFYGVSTDIMSKYFFN